MPLIKVTTAAAARSFACRAFYDRIGDTMSVGIKQKGKFHSSIEGEDFSLDLTKDGKLLNIDIWIPRNDWTIDKNIHPPEEFSKESIIFPESKVRAEAIGYMTNAARNLLYVRFSSERIARFVSPGSSLIFELNAKNQLVGFWITQIEEDINFQKESEWRRSIKAV
jgi:hypothetical protein